MFYRILPARSSRRLAAFSLFLLLAMPAVTDAATVCVSTGSELETALAAAGNSGTTSEIRLAVGVYTTSASGGFNANLLDGQDFTLSGGWNSSCSIRIRGQFSTIDGQLSRPGMSLSASAAGQAPQITVRRLAFINGFSNGQARAGGLTVTKSPESQARITIENSQFVGNLLAPVGVSTFGSALRVAGAELQISNNLFANNTGDNSQSGTGYAAELVCSGVQAVVRHNTVTANLGPSAGLFLSGSCEQSLVYNNILWGNAQLDFLHISSAVNLTHNLIGVRSGPTPSFESQTYNGNPRFVGPGNWRLRTDSPAIDRGAASDPFPFSWLPSQDLDGNDRWIGTAPDLGAYEQADAIFNDRFRQRAF